VDGAGADHDEQPAIALVENILHGGAALHDGAIGLFGHGHLFFDGTRRLETFRAGYTQVLCLLHKGKRL
jgi:hypothetical protein